MANAKQTQATRNHKPAAKGSKAPAAKRTATAKAAREAVEADEGEGDEGEGEGDEGEGKVSAWASELARAESGNLRKAENRFARLAAYLGEHASKAKPGAAVQVRAALVGEKCDMVRTTAGSWRTIVQRAKQYWRTVGMAGEGFDCIAADGTRYAVRFDAESMAIELARAE